MSFTQSVAYCLKNYFTFGGRGSRSEYWWFMLACTLADIAASVADAFTDYPVLGAVVSLGLLIPSITAAARRLHDTDRSGYWQLIAIIPLIGWIWLIVLLASQSKPGPNRFGVAAPRA